MGSMFSPKSPGIDPSVVEARKKAEKEAADKEALIAARESERRRSAALGFRGTGSLISAPGSTGFANSPTLGG
jgi:hypothetical protein